MKKKKNLIGIFLIVIGITLILTSLGIKIHSKNKEKKLINDFSEKLEDKKEFQVKNSPKNKEESKEENKEIKIGEEISQIEIPSINLKSIIIEGMKKEQLRYALCHFEDTAMPGEYGNFSIAGHSSSIYDEILNNLYKVKIGDEINLKTFKGEFNYKIIEKFVVEPSEVSVLDQDYNKKIMTIVTCTEGGKRRLIVRGEFFSKS